MCKIFGWLVGWLLGWCVYVCEEMEEDVIEVPVLLCSSEQDCFLFQYPLETKQSKSVVSSVKNVYGKPIQKKFQVSVVPDEEELGDDKKKTCFNLESSICSHRANYALAQWTGSSLVLKPIDGILQLRPVPFGSSGEPSKQGLAPPSIATNTTNNLLQDSNTGGRWLEESTEEEPEVVGVQVRKKETPKAAAWKRSSFHYQKMLRDEEPWKQLYYHVWNKSKSVDKVWEQFAVTPSEQPQENNHLVEQWMDIAVGKEENNRVVDIPQQVYAFLYQHRVVTLSSLMKLFPEESRCAVWRASSEYAVLVRHVWVLKSEFVSALSKVEQCCRDIILEMFSSQDYVKTSVIRERLVYVGQGIWKRILEEIGIHYKGLGWKLKAQDEDTYDDNHLLDTVRIEQQNNLVSRAERSIQYLQDYYQQQNSSSNLVHTFANHHDDNSTTPTSGLSSTKRNEHLRRWLFVFIKKNGTVSYNMVYSQAKKDLVYLFGEGNAQQESQWKSIFHHLLNEMCLEIRGCFVLKQLNNPSVDKYRNAILQLFMKHSKLKKSDIQKALEDNFLSISNSMYNNILHEFAIFKDQFWHLKEPPY